MTYFGGKSRHAAEVWRRFGNPDVYAEPFAGSLAVLLSRDAPGRREVVCDLDAHIGNFWRAMQADPEAVARHADWPTFHQDLTARHRWLIVWARENRERVSKDPDYYDAKAAGWWAWGRSNWIGHGWCRDDWNQAKRSRTTAVGVQVGRVRDGRPATHGHPTGAGVQVGRESWPKSRPQAGTNHTGAGVSVHRNRVPNIGTSRDGNNSGVQAGRQPVSVSAAIPALSRDPGGTGVQVQRKEQIPHVGTEPGGMGISANRIANPGAIGNGERLLPWFRALQQRLARVIVLARSWEAAVTPSILSDTASSPNLTRAIFLDPPYPTDQRKGGLYHEDDDGEVATAAYEWAVANGERYRICYCCLHGQFPVPSGWDEWTLRTKGSGATDLLMFSPACTPKRSLFAGT